MRATNPESLPTLDRRTKSLGNGGRCDILPRPGGGGVCSDLGVGRDTVHKVAGF